MIIKNKIKWQTRHVPGSHAAEPTGSQGEADEPTIGTGDLTRCIGTWSRGEKHLGTQKLCMTPDLPRPNRYMKNHAENKQRVCSIFPKMRTIYQQPVCSRTQQKSRPISEDQISTNTILRSRWNQRRTIKRPLGQNYRFF